MSQMIEMAKELGKLLAQTDEYQILKVTVASSGGDKEISDLREELSGIEDLIGEVLHAGNSPDDDLKSKYEDVANRLQANSAYQRLVSAQANFDKILLKVNQTIQKGIAEGSESRIIMP